MTLKQIKLKNKPKGITLPNLSQYTITEDGRIWSDIRLKFLKGGIIGNTRKYKAVYLKDDQDNQRWYAIHRLVAMAYVDNPDNKPEVDHIDNDPDNNHYTNLQWVTHQENIRFIFDRDGKQYPKGEDHWNYGREYSAGSRRKMSEKKVGENHPKFKGYYKYNGKLYSSRNQLAAHLNTYNKRITKLIEQGIVEFIPKAA